MKGKAKNKRKIGKVILIGMSFFLTIVLTFTITLAWFYDSDWASKYITMGGSVGISIMDKTGAFTSGSQELHFNLYNDPDDPTTNPLAYPGQAVDVSASCYNDGGKSGTGGSDCYVRARFAVFTNIGTTPNPDDYKVADKYPDGTTNPDYLDALDQLEKDKLLNAESLYSFLSSLIDIQNAKSASTGYKWIYYKRSGSLKLTDSGVEGTPKHYLDGQVYTSEQTANDSGYFYLCYDSTTDPSKENVLKPLAQGDEAVFLWNSTFVVPWQLTNASADKIIYVGLIFQAIQAYIPTINSANGTISQAFPNQLSADSCTYNNDSVQTVFNTCTFKSIPLKNVDINGTPYDFEDLTGSGFESFSDKEALNA